MIAAILRAQWLSMRSFRLGSGRRGALLSLLTATVWYGLWTVLALVAQELMAAAPSPAEIETRLARGLFLVFLYWQLAPLVSASLGASLDLRKLLVYPVPHDKLFVVEVLLRLTTCVEMLLILAGGGIGLLRNPGFRVPGAAARLAAPLLIFVLFNLLLSAGLRSILERLLARRHIREILVLVLVLLTALPRLLIETGAPFRELEDLFARGEYALWPWAAAARLVMGHGAAVAALLLAGWTGLAWIFGRRQFEASLRFDVRAAGATPAASAREFRSAGLFRLPALLLPDPVATQVEKELRTLSRTPRFRLVFIMGFTFGLVVWLPLVVGRRATGHSALPENFLILVAVYALTLLGQVSYWNSFGFDRSASQVYFSVPVPLKHTLVSKNLAAAIFIFLEIGAVTLACLVLRVRIPAAKILEVFLVTPPAALYMLALGNLSSVHYPRAMSPERVSQGGAAGRFQALMFLFYPLALLPVFMAFVARYAFDSATAFYLVLALAALVGVVVYWAALESAVATASRRREFLIAELSRGEGPVVQE